MENYLDKAKELRLEQGDKHNCTQAILVTFAQEMGMTEEQARGLGTHFGLGMGCGSACGVVTGVVAVLGAMGYDKKEAQGFMRGFQEKYGAVDCKVLLATCKERNEPRSEHCNRLIFQGVETVAEMIAQQEATKEDGVLLGK